MPTAKDIVVKKPTEEETATCKSWPVWTCELTVTDRPEGEVSVSFGPGDLVVFPVGLKCIWNVKGTVKKHYNFG